MLENLSYRFKIPLALTAAILLTELVLTTALVSGVFADARRDLKSSAENLASVLTRSVRDPLIRDDVWRTFEVIRTPLEAKRIDNPLKDIIVVETAARVYAASNPAKYRIATPVSALPEDFAVALRALEAQPKDLYFEFPELSSSRDVTAALPITSDDDTVLGYVVVAYDGKALFERVKATILRVMVISVPGLLLLIPLGLLWGNRMAAPLTRLADAMQRVGSERSHAISAGFGRSSKDEIGQLTSRFRHMLAQLAEKEALEKELIVTERLAAVGQVAAGIAHEINNPLGGMLNAVDTLSKHGSPDGLTLKTLGLLQRGLGQIRSTVEALLFEVRLDSAPMTFADWQDLWLLIRPQLDAKAVSLSWDVLVERSINLRAHLMRQLVLNLLLNAAKAVDVQGTVKLAAFVEDHHLTVAVSNSGQHIEPQSMAHLFEPFVNASRTPEPRSHGLGLWLSYQIVRELGGTISVDSEPGQTQFVVMLPLGKLEPKELHEQAADMPS